MNALTNWIPRADAGGGVQPIAVDISALGMIERKDGLVTMGRYGTELGSDKSVETKIARKLAKLWGMDFADQKVQDAAADFNRSSLQLVLGPGEDIVLNEDHPYLFVPTPGRPLAVPSQNKLPPGWRINSYKVKARVGQAEWVEPHAVRKVGYADYLEEEKRQGAEYYAIKYCYTIPDEWSNNILGVDDIGEKERAATEALDDFRERVSGFGDANKKIPGFFNSGDAVIGNGGQQFSSGVVVAQLMMRRLASFNRMYSRINNERQATRSVLPWSDIDAMKTTYFGAGGEGPSVWERAIGLYAWVRDSIGTDRLANANTTGDASRWAIYTPNTNEMYIENTETMVFGPFQNYMQFDFVLMRRIGGLVNKRPERLLYIDFTP